MLRGLELVRAENPELLSGAGNFEDQGHLKSRPLETRDSNSVNATAEPDAAGAVDSEPPGVIDREPLKPLGYAWETGLEILWRNIQRCGADRALRLQFLREGRARSPTL